MDWFAALDFDRARANVRSERYGDWYRDPWDWSELWWLVDKKRQDLLLPRLDSDTPSRLSLLDVPKGNYGIRPAVVLDPIDRLIYQALVDRISIALHRDLPDFVYGWRIGREKKPRRGRYAKNGMEWAQFQSSIEEFASDRGAALKTDIVSCFASVPSDSIKEMITERAGNERPVHLLIQFIKTWSRVATRPGIVQRSLPSSVLANAYLMFLDDVISRVEDGVQTGQPAVARWMDDIWIFHPDPARLRAVQVELSHAMRQHGFHMNTAKTDVLEGRELLDEILRTKLVGIDYAMATSSTVDSSIFEQLIDDILQAPEHADASEVRFLAKRVGEMEFRDIAERFIYSAPRMPHVADALSRMFRATGIASSMHGWFIDYLASGWASLDWPIAQFVTMFRSSERRRNRKLVDPLASFVLEGRQLALTAAAVHRLAAWDATTARDVFREASVRADHPSQRRLLALGGLAAGAGRQWVRSTLSEFHENQLTLEYLEDTAWKIPRSPRDFG